MTALNPRLTALLAQPEQVIEVNHHIPGLLEEMAPAQLDQTVTHFIATTAMGEALKRARHQSALSLRDAGKASGRSAPRIKAIEDTGTDIHLVTVVEHARALGYSVEVTLRPQHANAPVICANLSGAEVVEDQQERVNRQILAELHSLKQGMSRIEERMSDFKIATDDSSFGSYSREYEAFFNASLSVEMVGGFN